MLWQKVTVLLIGLIIVLFEGANRNGNIRGYGTRGDTDQAFAG